MIDIIGFSNKDFVLRKTRAYQLNNLANTTYGSLYGLPTYGIDYKTIINNQIDSNLGKNIKFKFSEDTINAIIRKQLYNNNITYDYNLEFKVDYSIGKLSINLEELE